jgi:uncharacterized protein YjbI with pentapeptide repeats
MTQARFKRTAIKETNWYAILELIVVPIVLLILSIGFGYFQANQQDNIEATRQAAQSTIEAGRAQDNILQTYFDDMTSLIGNPLFPEVRFSCTSLAHGNVSQVTSPLLNIARARTEVVINQLSGSRLTAVVRFLAETELIGIMLQCDLNGISLIDVDLGGANLKGLMLGAADLKYTNLGGARLQSAFLEDANLQYASLLATNLKEAVLADANLENANLFCAYLQDAILSGANLKGANLQNASLIDTSFSETTILPDGTLWSPNTNLTTFGALTSTQPNNNICPEAPN